jgi:hypothetical protein
LFPPLRAAGLVAPVFVMSREHAQLWQTASVSSCTSLAQRASTSAGQGGIRTTAAAKPPPSGAGTPAPDTVVLAGDQREPQAWRPHRAPGTGLLGLGDLHQCRAGRAGREEKLRILAAAGRLTAPVTRIPARRTARSRAGNMGRVQVRRFGHLVTQPSAIDLSTRARGTRSSQSSRAALETSVPGC